MATVQPISTLNIDGESFNVSDLSTEVQGLVTVYNEWNQKLADAQSSAALHQAALNDLSRQIILQVKTDNDAAAKAANDQGSEDTKEIPAIKEPSTKKLASKEKLS